MKFGYNNDNSNNNFRVNHQISKMANLDQNHFIFKKSQKTTHYNKQLKKLLINFTLILVELSVIILIAFYFISPLNRISHVSIVGNKTILASSMINNMKAKSGNSVFRLFMCKNYFEKCAIKQNAQLKSVHIDISNWNRIKMKMTEHPVVAYLKLGNHYCSVVNNGHTISRYTKLSQANPVLVNFEAHRNLRPFIKYYELVPNSVKSDIDKIKYVPNKIDPNRIHVYMNDGNQIYANYKNWPHKMKYYSAISKSMKKHGVINMELGVYSKAFNH